MSIDMSQLEDEIEFHCRNRNLPLLSQHHPMRELLLLHPLIIFLKLSVMPEAKQEARAIMHFHLYTLIRWEVDVVIARLFMMTVVEPEAVPVPSVPVVPPPSPSLPITI